MYFIELVYDWLFTVYEVAIRREYIVSMEFILLFLAVQIIHDILFYLLVLKTSSPGSNAIFDLINSYGKKHGGLTIVGDSFMVVLAVCMAWLLMNNDVEFSTYMICILLSLYMIGYLLYMKWQ